VVPRGERTARDRMTGPSGPLLLGIDAGTTAVKAALFDCELREIYSTRRAVAVAHPQPGWVEQDPEQILAAVVDAVAELLERADGREILAAGLDHQGESVLAWDADGRALTPVIVWQDKRQEELLAQIDEREIAASGLPLDPYFSAGKLAWLLEHDSAVQRARRRARSCSPSADTTGMAGCCPRSACDASGCPRSDRASASSESCATSAGACRSG